MDKELTLGVRSCMFESCLSRFIVIVLFLYSLSTVTMAVEPITLCLEFSSIPLNISFPPLPLSNCLCFSCHCPFASCTFALLFKRQQAQATVAQATDRKGSNERAKGGSDLVMIKNQLIQRSYG